MQTAHWTETVTDSLSLVQAFIYDFNPSKGDKVTSERAERFAARCVNGVDAFWSALAGYLGTAEATRIRGLKTN